MYHRPPQQVNLAFGGGGFAVATAIEKALYGNLGVHGVTDFAVSAGVVWLRVAPWVGPPVHTAAIFRDARVTSVEAYPTNPGDLDPPWDVIGFDSDDLGGGRWRFVLHCASIEWCFESAWPDVERADAEPPYVLNNLNKCSEGGYV